MAITFTCMKKGYASERVVKALIAEMEEKSRKKCRPMKYKRVPVHCKTRSCGMWHMEKA